MAGADAGVAASVVRGFLDLAGRRGVDVRALIPQDVLPDALLEDPDSHVDWRTLDLFVETLVAALGMAESIRLIGGYRRGDTGLFDYIAANSPTVGDALRAMVRYARVRVGAAEWSLRETEDAMVLTQVIAVPLRAEGGRFCMTFFAASVVSLLASLPGASAGVGAEFMDTVRVELHFVPVTPEEEAACREVVRARLDFGAPRTAVFLPRRLSELPVSGTDPRLGEIVRAQAEKILARLPDGREATTEVRRTVLPLLAEGEPTLAEIARRLGTSARTLQRRLRDEGTAFQQVLDDLRREAAIANIEAAKMSADEIAYLLGFSATSAFSRAFKRWTGQTPGEFRKRGRAA